jgi:hypothetical protein
MPTIKARPGRFQETDPTARPTAVSRPRPRSTAVPQRPKAGGIQKPMGSRGEATTPGTAGTTKPRPGSTGSTGGTFVPSELSDPSVVTSTEDGLTLPQYQPGLSMGAKVAIGAAVLVGIVGLVMTVRRRVRGDVREGS